jgi:hypothetical protein
MAVSSSSSRGEDVLVGHHAGQVRGDAPGVELHLHHGVVAGEPLQPLVAVLVDARVAHVGQVRHAVLDEEGAQGGAHAGVGRVGQGLLPDPQAGLVHGVAHALPEHVGVVLDDPVQACLVRIQLSEDDVPDGLHRDLGGDLASGVPAHAVGQQEQAFILADGEEVFVLFPDGARIGQGVGLGSHGAPRAWASV